MAAHMEGSDNPVAVNITAMVDVIFCLCIFFMCSFHFKQTEGKIETWLPKEKGVRNIPAERVVLEEIRVSMTWDAAAGRTLRHIGRRDTTDDIRLAEAFAANKAHFDQLGKPAPVVVDATYDVPWTDVIHVMDLCKQERLERVELTAPMER